MESYELAKYANVDENQLSEIINDQFEALSKVKQNVEQATQKADTALQAAESAAKKGAGFLQKKEAIESLQDAAVDLADAQVAAAEAQEISFEYQQKLTEMSKFLLNLGVNNIAANRCVVRDLKLKLKGASEEQLDDLARQEIASVIQQLNAQVDIMKRQQDLTTRVKGHDTRIGSLEDQNKINIQKIEERIAHEGKQDERIKQNTKKSEELGKRDDAQDAELKRQAEKDSEHDKRLDAGDQKDKSQDEELARQALKNTEHDEQIKALEDKMAALEDTCNQLSETIKALDTNHINNESELRTAIDSRFTHEASVVSAIVGALGLIAAIISFFL